VKTGPTKAKRKKDERGKERKKTEPKLRQTVSLGKGKGPRKHRKDMLLNRKRKCP